MTWLWLGLVWLSGVSCGVVLAWVLRVYWEQRSAAGAAEREEEARVARLLDGG